MMTEWMIVYTTHDLTEAHIVAGRLEVEGIKSLIQRETLGALYGFLAGPLSEVNIAVHPDDYQHALELLEPDDYYPLADGTDDIIYYHPDQDDDHDDIE